MHNVSPARRSRWQCHAKRRDANMDSNPVPARPHSEISRQQQVMCHNKHTNRRFIQQKHSLRIPLLTNLFVSKTIGCAINSSFRSLASCPHIFSTKVSSGHSRPCRGCPRRRPLPLGFCRVEVAPPLLSICLTESSLPTLSDGRITPPPNQKNRPYMSPYRERETEK